MRALLWSSLPIVIVLGYTFVIKVWHEIVYMVHMEDQ